VYAQLPRYQALEAFVLQNLAIMGNLCGKKDLAGDFCGTSQMLLGQYQHATCICHTF
jgi:hypothetical protein